MIREAVLGMLPKNKLRARRAKKLRVYRDAAGLARHAGQKPQAMARVKRRTDVTRVCCSKVRGLLFWWV